MLKVGFSRIDITPPLGTYMQGYFSPRQADGILDPLLASCIAFSDGERTAVVFSLDLIGIGQSVSDEARKIISEMAHISADAVFLACTHTHTGPVMKTVLFPHNPVYNAYCFARLGSAAMAAIDDLKPAKMLSARGSVKNVAFIRRFRMKDGTIRTNPGYLNPNIRTPISTPDEMLQLVRIIREGGEELALINFQVHPDVIGGTKWSADFPGFVRRTFEGAVPGIRCIYFNGAQGDTNHIDVSRDRNGPDTETFPVTGYKHSAYMGRAIAGAALAVYDTAQPLADGKVSFAIDDLIVPANLPKPEDIPHAKHLIELHESGRDAEIPESGMGVTTLVAEAYRMVRLEHAAPDILLRLSSVTAGDLAFAGIPGEPFTDVGRGIKEASPYSFTIPCCVTNGSEGYFPMYSAFAEGGYEARSSRFCPGVAEEIVAGHTRMLRRLHG
ncbi:MAG: hypothetical protein GX929_02150 [Clostridiales bacterium]|jgi:neutral ceramidase|nr:hypothetical protein [Clostridiales bacterium]